MTTDTPRLDGSTVPGDPIRGVVSIGYHDDVHPYHAQLMYAPVSPTPLPGQSVPRQPSRLCQPRLGVRKWPRAEDRLTFDEEDLDEDGLPGIRIAYALTDREESELDRARLFQARSAAAIGDFLPGMPVRMPAGSSLHYMGTVRIGPIDDGTSVCDTFSRVWSVPGLILAGDGLIPTANACNPTLTSVALAVRGVLALAEGAGAPHLFHHRSKMMTEFPSRSRVPESVDVAIVGSGPTGAAYARILSELAPDAAIAVFEAGPVLSDPPGQHVKNIADPAARLTAQRNSEGPAAHRAAAVTQQTRRSE